MKKKDVKVVSATTKYHHNFGQISLALFCDILIDL